MPLGVIRTGGNILLKMGDSRSRVMMIESSLALAKLHGILLGFGHGDKQRQENNGAACKDHPSAHWPFFRSGVEGSSEKESDEQTGNQPAQMGHIVDVALKAKKQVQKSEPDNITEQFADTFRLESKLPEVEDADQRASDAKDCTGSSRQPTL